MFRVITHVALIAVLAASQIGHAQGDSLTLVQAARILDVRAGRYLLDTAILIRNQRIEKVGPVAHLRASLPEGTRIIDLGPMTVLPGLIDCHTHLMARVPEGDNGYATNLLTKSEATRALEGAANARLTLAAGFTSVRDVENEGAGYADIALRDAIRQGLIDGPRMQVATRGIAVIGQYFPFNAAAGVSSFPTGAQMISGVEEARRAVREQIGRGADLIKIYADWSYPTLTPEEIRVIVEEAHRAERKVAAHATTPQGIRNAVEGGVDSIEHGFGADRKVLELMKTKGVFLVSTVSVIDAEVRKNPDDWRSEEMQAFLKAAHDTPKLARTVGVKMAIGSDPASVDRHGKNAEELVALAGTGMPPIEVVRAATINAAELLGRQDDIGSIEPGRYADLIGVTADPLADVSALMDVKFVMKAGRVFRGQGAAD